MFSVLVLAAGCGAGPQGKAAKLNEAITKFNEDVRWGRVQEALAQVHQDSRPHFVEMHREFGNAIQLTSYDIVGLSYSEKEKIAEVSVQITWYRLDQMEAQVTLLSQRWEERDGKWSMVAEQYRSGKPF